MAIGEAVRSGDRTAWLAALFAPESVRWALHALTAYRLELERIVAAAREPMAAEVRLQWWRDAIRDEGYGAGASVPLVDALREGARRYLWPLDTLCAVSEAHIHDLYADPFEDWDAFDGFAGESYGALTQLAAMALAVDALGPSDGAAAARSAATASGWAGVTLAAADAAATFVPRFAAGRARVPESVWRAHAAVPLAEALPAGRPPGGAAVVVRAVVRHGEEADAALRDALSGVAPVARAALLPALLARGSLRAAAQAPLAPRLPSAWRAQLALWREARRLARA